MADHVADQDTSKKQTLATTESHGNASFDDGEVVTIDRAQQATRFQHEISLKDAFRLYRRAIGWSLLFSIGVVMTGFDPQLIGAPVAIPAFQRQFGKPLGDGTYVIEAQWQSAFNIGVPVGQVVGSLGVGIPLDRFGRRITLAACCIISCIAVALQSSSQNKPQILSAELVNGIALGAYPVIATTYISEVTPVVFRGVAAASINTSFVIGQLVASGVLAGTQNRGDRWSYGIPFLVQFVFPIIILALLPFCPESPWHLVRKGKHEKAERALQRLIHSSVDPAVTLAHIKFTTALEQEAEHHAGKFADCFKGTNLRRTIISTVVYSVQNLAGGFFVIGYAVYFFQLAGLATSDAFNLGVGVLAVGLVGTLLSWPLISVTGRRRIFTWGLAVLVILLFLIAILDVVPNNGGHLTILWVQSSPMVVYNFFFDLTIGPLSFVILSETSSPKLRSKTIAIATTVNALTGVACAVGIPYAINPDQGNLKGKLAFVFFGLGIPCLIWCFLALPEMKGRTFDELGITFLRKVRTRDFKTYVIEDWTERDDFLQMDKAVENL